MCVCVCHCYCSYRNYVPAEQAEGIQPYIATSQHRYRHDVP